MAFDYKLADKVRQYLSEIEQITIQEKSMFGGLAFLVNEKMCINISANGLMCRFDPKLTDTIAKRNGFEPMIMNGKEYKGYCYVTPEGFKNKKDFDFWMKLCLDYNSIAKSSNSKKK